MGHFYWICPLPFLLPSIADGDVRIRAVPSSVLSFWDTILFNLEVLMRVIIQVGTSKVFPILLRGYQYFSFIFYFCKSFQLCKKKGQFQANFPKDVSTDGIDNK